MGSFREIMGMVGALIDSLGVAVVFFGMFAATGRFLLRRYGHTDKPFTAYRQDLGRAIILGLEFMIAGDMIRTVSVAPTLRSVGVLGFIVLVRTFLSMSLELELEGRWPWEGAPKA